MVYIDDLSGLARMPWLRNCPTEVFSTVLVVQQRNYRLIDVLDDLLRDSRKLEHLQELETSLIR